jgi:hypothetical protein
MWHARIASEMLIKMYDFETASASPRVQLYATQLNETIKKSHCIERKRKRKNGQTHIRVRSTLIQSMYTVTVLALTRQDELKITHVVQYCMHCLLAQTHWNRLACPNTVCYACNNTLELESLARLIGFERPTLVLFTAARRRPRFRAAAVPRRPNSHCAAAAAEPLPCCSRRLRWRRTWGAPIVR